jgi:hypothetical protein
MSRNINAQAVLLSNVAATDVAYLNGNLNVKGVGSIPVKKITSATRIGQASGSQIETNTITVGTATAGTVFNGSITQVIEGATYTWPFTYTAVSGDTTTTIATALKNKIQEGIDGNQILGTVSNLVTPGTTIVFVGTSVAPAAGVVVSAGLSNAKTYTVAWSAGAYTSSASVSSLAGFTNLVVGNLYRVNFGAGSTGADAAYFNLQTGFGLATSATAMTIFAGIPATVTIGATTSTTSALAEPAGSLASLMTGTDGYSATAPYVGYLIEFETANGVEAGVVSPVAILFNASDTNALAFERALTAGFNGSSAFTSLNTLA